MYLMSFSNFCAGFVLADYAYRAGDWVGVALGTVVCINAVLLAISHHYRARRDLDLARQFRRLIEEK